MALLEPEPLWDVVEEHLDEAEFLWEQWERGLVAPNYTLEELAEGPEARLMAHIDGLVVHGPRAASRLLVPALESEEPGRVSAAATALLLGGGSLDAVIEALRDLPEQREGLVRALECVEDRRVVQGMRALLADDDEEVVAAAARVLCSRGESIADSLGLLLASELAGSRALALRAAALEPEPASFVRGVHAGLADEASVVVDAAIAAGVRLALPGAWARAQARAQEPDGGAALVWLALRGGAEDRETLLAALQAPERRAAGLWALGFLGAPEGVEAALEWLEDPVTGRLAGELIAAVTGVDLEDADLTRAADEEESLEHGPEDDLPRPDAMAVLQWWTQRRGAFAAGQRYLGGAPWSLAGVVQQLRVGPMRRREALLDAVAMVDPGAARLVRTTRAPTWRQVAELERLAAALRVG